jgi:hypothetical protein
VTKLSHISTLIEARKPLANILCVTSIDRQEQQVLLLVDYKKTTGKHASLL